MSKMGFYDLFAEVEAGTAMLVKRKEGSIGTEKVFKGKDGRYYAILAHPGETDAGMFMIKPPHNRPMEVSCPNAIQKEGIKVYRLVGFH